MVDYAQITECVFEGVFQGGLFLMLTHALIDFCIKLIDKLRALYKLKKFQKELNKIKKGDS